MASAPNEPDASSSNEVTSGLQNPRNFGYDHPTFQHIPGEYNHVARLNFNGWKGGPVPQSITLLTALRIGLHPGIHSKIKTVCIIPFTRDYTVEFETQAAMASVLNTPLQVLNKTDKEFFTTYFTHLHKETTCIKIQNVYDSVQEEAIKAPFISGKSQVNKVEVQFFKGDFKKIKTGRRFIHIQHDRDWIKPKTVSICISPGKYETYECLYMGMQNTTPIQQIETESQNREGRFPSRRRQNFSRSRSNRRSQSRSNCPQNDVDRRPHTMHMDARNPSPFRRSPRPNRRSQMATFAQVTAGEDLRTAHQRWQAEIATNSPTNVVEAPAGVEEAPAAQEPQETNVVETPAGVEEAPAAQESQREENAEASESTTIEEAADTLLSYVENHRDTLLSDEETRQTPTLTAAAEKRQTPTLTAATEKRQTPTLIAAADSPAPFVQGIDDLPDIVDVSDEEEDGEIKDSSPEQVEENAPPESPAPQTIEGIDDLPDKFTPVTTRRKKNRDKIRNVLIAGDSHAKHWNKSDEFVKHLGFQNIAESGYTAQKLNRKLKSTKIPATTKHTIISIGTNDADKGLKNTISELCQAIQEIKAQADSKIYLMDIYPRKIRPANHLDSKNPIKMEAERLRAQDFEIHRARLRKQYRELLQINVIDDIISVEIDPKRQDLYHKGLDPLHLSTNTNDRHVLPEIRRVLARHV